MNVTDTRDASEIPEGAARYVLGSATAFTGQSGQTAIGAENLGWAPRLIDGGASGLVSEGEAVAPVLDEEATPDNVGLGLVTPSTVAAGSYTSVLTLSLFP